MSTTYKKTLAIDFDGVIHKYSEGWKEGVIYDNPVEGVIEALKDLLKTYHVFILTSRDPEGIIEWMERYGFNIPLEIIGEGAVFWHKDGVLGITNKKLPAVAYIDDRGVRFTNWKDMLNLFS